MGRSQKENNHDPAGGLGPPVGRPIRSHPMTTAKSIKTVEHRPRCLALAGRAFTTCLGEPS